MISIKKVTVTLALLVISILAYSQKSLPSSSSIFIESTVLDTIKTNLNSMEIEMLWLADTIRVRTQNAAIKIDSSLVKLLRETDTSALKSQKDIDKFRSGLQTGGQNCYSYALEKYFDNNETFSQTTFGRSTHLYQKSAEKILKNYFSAISEIPVSSKSHLKQVIPNNTLLAFMTDYGTAIHFVYYNDDIFYSKNGSFKPIEFKSLRKFLKMHYQDTHSIIAYKIDDHKVKILCDNKGYN